MTRPTCDTCRFWGNMGKCNKRSGWKRIPGFGPTHILVTTEHNDTCGEHTPKDKDE